MRNPEIWSVDESWSARADGTKMHIKKHYRRTASDAAILPDHAIEFEFQVSAFPFNFQVYPGSSGISTAERGAIPQRAVATARDRINQAIRALEDVGEPDVPNGSTARIRDFGNFDPTSGREFDFPPLHPANPIPFEIILTPPNGLAPLVYTNPKPDEIGEWPRDETAKIDPEFLKKAIGKWRITVRNNGTIARRAIISVSATYAVSTIRKKLIPLSLINHLGKVALKKVQPTIEYANGQVNIRTPTHFLELEGINSSFDLAGVLQSVATDLPEFTPISAEMMSPKSLKERLIARKASLAEEYNDLIEAAQNNLTVGWSANWISNLNSTVTTLNERKKGAMAHYDKAISKIANYSTPSFSQIYIILLEGLITDPGVEFTKIGNVAEFTNKLPQVAFIFDGHLGFTDVISTISADLSPALTKTILLAGVVTAGLILIGSNPIGFILAAIGLKYAYSYIDGIDIEEKIESGLRGKGDSVAGYTRKILERITDLGANAEVCALLPGGAVDGSDALQISYWLPSDARAPLPRMPFDELPTHNFEMMRMQPGIVKSRPVRSLSFVQEAGSEKTGSVPKYSPIRRETPGPIPAEFLIPDGHTLPRLDAHDAIVVIMMENRSYDHYFRELPDIYPGKGYSRPPDSYENLAPTGFSGPFRPVKHDAIGIGDSLIFESSSQVRFADPAHGMERTLFQIGGGTDATIGTGEMLGFAADFAKQSDSPAIAMSYFGMESLPVYKALAGQYPACDRWFAALPTSTHPNRLSMLQGDVSILRNFNKSDENIGYLEDYSVLDLMTSQGIPWLAFESDISTPRFYDRQRLNVENIRPIDELRGRLKSYQQGQAMPRVMFIEPQFLYGNDDHPPMSIQYGQEFLRQAVGLFIEHDLLRRVMFVITYDEHGGFCDHVPPPGTARGDPAYGEFNPLFTRDPSSAPQSLGVRVPSMVLSPLTAAQANHTIFDHTSILKTILLHNRSAISSGQFLKFGKRVLNKSHLGQVLTRTTPRVINYQALETAMGYVRNRQSWDVFGLGMFEQPRASIDLNQPARVLHSIADPRIRRVQPSN